MISGWIAELGPWHWLLLAIALIILEALSPAAFFMWLAVAAGLVGLALAVFPDVAWQIQLVLFAVFSVLSLIVGRHYLKRHPIATDEPTLNKRGHQYIGRVFTLDLPIVNGVGKLRVDDTTWKIAGSDCAEGTKVEVAGVDGVVLLVMPAD
jgi:hypothetical protein